MKSLAILSFFLFVLGVLLFLVQMWFNLMSADTFMKVSITNAALFVITFALNFMIKENKQTSKINEGKDLDL